MINLRFVETHRYNFPVSTTGTGVGLTVARVSGDPCLVFLTQTAHDDEFVYLRLTCDEEIKRHTTPPGRLTVGGMAYDRFTDKIWCSQATSSVGQLFAIDPNSELEVDSIDVSADVPPWSGHGLATNGLFMVLTHSSKMDLRMMNGAKVAEKNFPGRRISGVTKSPLSWAFVDVDHDEIVIIDPFGNEVAKATTHWKSIHSITKRGAQAIAFNEFISGEHEPQQWICPGGLIDTDPDSVHNPATPWNPEPWSGRHRIYIANQIDQVIYAGYLTAEP